ncbi:MAG TPA: MATE family efflux transporter [Candidatus Kapabacteria bacterium]|nr:MATE family efflux transporter [Candidatus Kapabacteria bacterium]
MPEARAMIALALPVVADQLGVMSMALVDTIMVGHLGSAALGSVGIGASVYFFFMVFGYGTISGVGPTVAQAHGARDPREIERSVAQAFWLAWGLTALGQVVAWSSGAVLRAMNEPPELIPLATSFVHAIAFGMPATFMYAVLRAFTTGLGRTRITMMIALAGALINVAADYALIYGKLGAPALGVAGAGYATAIVQWCMFALMLVFVLRSGELRQYRIFPQILPLRPTVIARLVRLGMPIGGSNSLEVGFFGLTALLMGNFGKQALAAHQVALNVASFTFMIPLGIGIATSTRVGQFIGARNRAAARTSGWVGIGLATLVMMATAIALVSIPGPIIGIYTSDGTIFSYATGFLVIAGAFQIFDGIQVATLGALRGLKDTSRPMLVNLIAYWAVGVPSGYLLAFVLKWNGQGLWWGLTIGLAAASVLHLNRFRLLIGTASGSEAASADAPADAAADAADDAVRP